MPDYDETPRFRVCRKAVRLKIDGTAGAHGHQGQPCSGTGHPPADDPPCLPTCRSTGTIGWPRASQLKPREAHRSTVVCDSPSHQREASAWVEAGTGHPGVYEPFRRAVSELELAGQLRLGDL